MCIIKIVYLVLLLWIYNSSSAEGSCILNLPDKQITQPKITRYLGSMEIAMQYTNNMIFFKNEKFDARCSTKFTDRNFDQEKYTFECNSNNVINLWDEPRRCNYYGQCNVNLLCESPVLAIYESSHYFDWCNNTKVYGSFNIVVNNTIEMSKIAEICFKYETRSPHIIKYFSVPKTFMDHNNLSMITELWDNNVPDIEIPFENEMNSPVEFGFKIALDYLPAEEKFEYDNLVQDGILHKLEAGKSTASIIWWHNLRISNWKRYLDALNTQSEKSIYKIYAGTAGHLKIPGESNSKDFQNIPAYVWNVVQAVNVTEEFVIMGYNSPYFELFEEKETIICEDICDTITWLKEIRQFFKISHFGRIFCCSLEDTLETNMLEGLTL